MYVLFWILYITLCVHQDLHESNFEKIYFSEYTILNTTILHNIFRSGSPGSIMVKQLGLSKMQKVIKLQI